MDEKKDVQKSKMRTRLISKCKYCTISTSYYIVLHSDAIWMSLVIAETWGPIGSRIGDMTSRFANVEGFSADKSGLWSFTCTKEWTTQDSENDRRIKRVFFISSYLVQLNLKPFAHDSLCLGAFGASWDLLRLWFVDDQRLAHALDVPRRSTNMSIGYVEDCPDANTWQNMAKWWMLQIWKKRFQGNVSTSAQPGFRLLGCCRTWSSSPVCLTFSVLVSKRLVVSE